MNLRKHGVAAVAALALGMGAAPLAGAATAHAAPADKCAVKTAQLAKAQERLAILQARFADKKEDVTEARAEVRQADKAAEKRKAREALAKAKKRKDVVKKAKKAQLKRVEQKQAQVAKACA